MLKDLLRSIDPKAVAIAGAAAGLAYLATMELDLKAFNHDADDRKFLAGIAEHDPVKAKKIGTGIHAFNSIALATAYAAVAHDRIPGPAWLRGVIFANVENALLYPLCALDQKHPLVKSGDLDRYWNKTAFAQAVVRHVAYGAVLGATYEQFRKRRG